MNPVLRKVMLPGAIAVAVAGFVGAFGGSTPAAYAIDEDICQVDVDSRAGTTHDGQGNDVYVVSKGTTYGLVFRVEDAGRWPDNNVTVRVDSETGSGRITSKAEILGYEDDDLILAQDEEAEADDDAETTTSRPTTTLTTTRRLRPTTTPRSRLSSMPTNCSSVTPRTWATSWSSLQSAPRPLTLFTRVTSTTRMATA